jgi:hypothetical protein
MVIIWYATQNTSDGNAAVLSEALTESLSKIELMLDNSL